MVGTAAETRCALRCQDKVAGRALDTLAYREVDTGCTTVLGSLVEDSCTWAAVGSCIRVGAGRLAAGVAGAVASVVTVAAAVARVVMEALAVAQVGKGGGAAVEVGMGAEEGTVGWEVVGLAGVGAVAWAVCVEALLAESNALQTHSAYTAMA